MQQNKTYAKILEQQGFFEEAFSLYKKLLLEYPNDIEIKKALKRLKRYRSKFDGVNIQKRDFFIYMKDENDFRKFEEWLIG